MAWVSGPTSFLVMRFLLGVAEAGFFPGVILYLTYWFPARYRARIISAFMLSIPVSLVVGAPLSTAILGLNGFFGMKGWQWLFIVEALPALLLAIPVLFMLPVAPGKAKWLSESEKSWLEAELAAERGNSPQNKKSWVLQALGNPTILALCFIYFCATAVNLGLSFFMPQIIKLQGYSNIQVGLLTALPYLFGCAGMLGIGYLSDRFNERRWFLIGTMLTASAGPRDLASANCLYRQAVTAHGDRAFVYTQARNLSHAPSS